MHSQVFLIIPKYENKYNTYDVGISSVSVSNPFLVHTPKIVKVSSLTNI